MYPPTFPRRTLKDSGSRAFPGRRIFESNASAASSFFMFSKAEKSTKDGVPTLTREAPPEPPASRSTVGPLRAGDGQDSGLVLTLDDAEDIRQSDRPPPHPGATERMLRPPQFEVLDRPWHRR